MFGINKPGMLDEMESSEKPYMRRSRAVAVRKSRIPQGIRRFVWWAGLIIFVLVPLGTGGALLGSYLLNSPRFQLTSPADVTIQGNHYVSRDEVLAAMGILAGASRKEGNIFSCSLTRKEKQVESIPWVRSATIVRSYPHGLAVYVSERVPVAFVDVGSRIKMVDRQGVLLESPEKGHFDFPIVKGLDFNGSAEDRAARLNLYQQFMQETSQKMANTGWVVSEVDLSDASNLKALLVQGGQTLLVYFGSSGFLARFENLITVLPQLRRTNARIDSVDLRFRNQVVVNPAGQDPTSGQSSGNNTTGKTKGT